MIPKQQQLYASRKTLGKHKKKKKTKKPKRQKRRISIEKSRGEYNKQKKKKKNSRRKKEQTNERVIKCASYCRIQQKEINVNEN